MLRNSLLTLALTLSVLLMLASRGPSSEADEGDESPAPILELVLDVLPEGHDAARLERSVRSLEDALSVQDGFVRSDVALVPGNPARLLRATVWASVEQAEAASLGLDGSPSQQELLQVVDGRQRIVKHFRQLRTQSYDGESTGQLEATVYRTRPGTTREANLKLFDAAEPDFAQGAGVLQHSMWIAPDGQWTHVVHWRSQRDFETTGKALMKTTGVGAWIRSLDFQRFTVWKGDTL